ncbi:MAG: Lrp/AsnC ligand binding domain-containing protein [Caldilineaceae bacterium]|nr:Lrp/AsnC ligand binding domain-containing protein [Caldilineaceae bacterium]
MVTAIILIKAARQQINDVAQQLVEMRGVAEVYSVGGRYDLVAIIRVSSNEKMADLITNQMLGLAGIEDTETLIAFRAFSKHDLESMFALGLES